MRQVRVKYRDGVVVSREVTEIEPPALPGIGTMARSLGKAALQAIKNPVKVSDTERQRRLEICQGCEFLIRGKSHDRCSKCGCFIKWKTALESWHCPINKW
jgi:hypothetical protein